MSNQNRNSQLYNLQFAARPSPEHPLFYEVQFLYLNCFIIAAEEREAIERARNIIRALPYELLAELAVVAPVDESWSSRFAPDLAAVAVAKQVGWHFWIYHWPTGEDEAAFTAQWVKHCERLATDPK